MYSIDEFIRQNDKENIVKKAILSCLVENMTKEIALDILASDLQKHLYDFISESEDLEIDGGSNVKRGFTKVIKDVLHDYFTQKGVTVLSKERLSEKLQAYAKAYKEPPYGREVDGTVELLEEVADKLAEYEDLEEQGLLLRLPVAVGSKVYEIIEETVPEHHYYITEYEVQDISAKAVMYADDWCSFDYPNLYFSRAEAEEKLRELEGK